MRNYAPINDDKDVITKEYADIIKSQCAINRTTLGTQCKNLLKNTAATKTVNGVKFTVNDDKSITVSGTATSRIIFLVGTAYISQTGNYTYTGTPSGGASATYSMNYRNSSVYKTAETGSGITAQFEGGKTYEAVIDIRSGVTISNLTFYPMLRDADITDETYEPYQASFADRCLLKDTAGIALGASTSSSITIDNLASYTALWINVAGAVAGINFITNLIVPVAYLAKSTSNSVQLAGGIPSSAYTTSSGVLAAKNMSGYITAKVSGNTLSLTISDGTLGSVEVVSMM